MLRALVALALLASVGVGQAETLTVTLRQTAEPIRHVYPGRTLAVDGIELGMTVEEVRRKLAVPGAFVQDVMERSPLSLSEQGVTAVAQPYIFEINSLQHDDASNTTIAVRFGLPSTGSRVISVRSIKVFNKTASQPTMETVLAQLRNAYGPTSTDDPVPVRRVSVTVPWVFNDTKQVSCNSNCGLSDLALDDDELASSRGILLTGRHVGLIAMLSRPETDAGPVMLAGRLRIVSVSLYDYANMTLTFEKGVEQLRTAIFTMLKHQSR